MIPKKHRISKAFFEEIYKNGKGFSSPFLSIKVLGNKEKTNLFAVVVSKKVSKIAPQRNFVKRRVSYILKQQKNLIKQGYFIVFQIKPELLKKEFLFYKEQVLTILKKAGLLL